MTVDPRATGAFAPGNGSGWSARRYRQDDEAGVLRLMKIALGEAAARPRTPEFFRWKHFENPFGSSFIWIACTADGEPVGLRAFMRWDLEAGGVPVRAVQAVDTATHPAFRRRGIFSALTRTAAEVVREEGVDLVFNTPNVYSRPGYRKLGWEDVGHMVPMIRVARPLRFFSGLARAGFGGVAPEVPASGEPRHLMPVETLLAPGSGFDAFSSRAVAAVPRQDRLGTRRTIEFMRWRYACHPNLVYRAVTAQRGADLEGCAILRTGSRFGLRETLVSEIFVARASRGLVGDLLDQLTDSAQPDYLLAFAPEGSFLREALRHCGFRTIPSSAISAAFESGILSFASFQKPRRLMVNPLSRDLPIDPGRLSNWNFSLGDLEVF